MSRDYINSKYTTATFIEKANEIHNFKYDYSLTNYINIRTKIIIICNIHGQVIIRPDSHLVSGCTKCSSTNSHKNTDEFVSKSKEKFGDRFDYTLTTYVNTRTKISIICKKHGMFTQWPRTHLKSIYGCSECGNDTSYEPNFLDSLPKYSNVDVSPIFNKSIEKSISPRHIQVNIKSFKNKSIVSKFERTSLKLKNSAIIKCNYGRFINKTTEQFINRAKEIHGNIYDYSLVDYKNCSISVDIICKKHGVFRQQPRNHLRGGKCIYCTTDAARLKLGKPNDIFIKECMEVHGDIYDYSNTKYINKKTKISILCRIHGEFNIRAGHHTSGIGCVKCKPFSKGQNKISEILNERYEYYEEHSFDDCRNPLTNYPLRFDFYIPSLKTVIEYNGKQHYEPIEFFGGALVHEKTRIRDEYKEQYCNSNNIKFIVIKYDENIEQKLIEYHIIEPINDKTRL